MTASHRWQLHRAGIANVYQYENDVFTFRGGRLLLRGVNGSGKSTAMNMLLPFLLTGKLRGIDAAGEQTGVLKSWMLSGRDEKQPVGYLWLEFARSVVEPQAQDPQQPEPQSELQQEPQQDSENLETLTIGCGIKANRASDTVNTWWFVTSRRPGIDFDFLEQQVPLSVDALRTVIAPDPVYAQDRRRDYRQEVSRRLYAGANIESFLDLINTVRSPRVGDRVDIDLPQYLVAALPNLSEAALLEAARPLDDLDEHRRNVADLQTTAAGLEAIVKVYRNYAVTELHGELAKAGAVLSDVRRERRESKSAQQAYEEAQIQEQQLRESLAELQSDVQQCALQIQTLERSSAYTEGQQLEDLRKHVISLKQRLDEDADNLQKLQARQPEVNASVRRLEQQTDECFTRLAQELQHLTAEVNEVSVEARPPAITPIPRVVLQPGSSAEALSEPLEDFDSDGLKAQLRSVAAASAARHLDVDAASKQLQLVELATRELRDAQSAHAQALETVEDTTTRFENGRTALQQARETWGQSVQSWLQSTRSLITSAQTPVGFKRVEAAWLNEESATAKADLSALRMQLENNLSQTRDAQLQTVVSLEANVKQASHELDEAQTELDRLNALTEPEVPLLSWQKRATPSLADLVDFKDHVTAVQRAALEASMEASGLLSATLNRDGALLVNGDLLLITEGRAEHPLSALLVPTVPSGSAIENSQVQKILDAISTNDSEGHHSTVTTDGKFSLGALSGKHSKDIAEYIGVSARRERLERLRQAAKKVVQLATETHRQLVESLNVAQAFAEDLKQSRNTLPTLDQVDRAQAVALALEEELQKARERLSKKEQSVTDTEKQVHVADEALHRLCRTSKLPVDAAGLRRIESTLSNIKSVVSTAERSAASVAQTCIEWTNATSLWRVAQQDLQQAKQRHESTQSEYTAQHARLNTLESTLGTEYRAVVEQIERFVQQQRSGEQQIPPMSKRCDESIRLTQKRLNEVDNRQAAQRLAEQACITQQEHLHEVTQVSGLLAALTVEQLLQSAAQGQSESSGVQTEEPVYVLPVNRADVDGLNDLVGSLRELLPPKTKDDTSADGVRISLRQQRNKLGAGWDAEDSQPLTTMPMSINVNGPLGQMPLAESLANVQTQLNRLQALLTEKQDQALRNLLQGLIAREVAEKMFQATRLIERMNSRLSSVTSTHGIGVKLRWRQSRELDDAVAQTVKILAKQPDLRSEAEEKTLREALASALDEERRLEPDAPYRQLISKVFDYRAWHQMDVLLRRGDDPQIRLTRGTPLSEGEKKLVSYLPLFAAVAASCDALIDSGGDSVPRFLLLDDAFAKVSEDNHAPLFGLLVDLDLDFIATSERLWGTHSSVPSLAITEVVRDTTLGTILLEHSYWDGKTLRLSAANNLEFDTWGEAVDSSDNSGDE